MDTRLSRIALWPGRGRAPLRPRRPRPAQQTAGTRFVRQAAPHEHTPEGFERVSASPEARSTQVAPGWLQAVRPTSPATLIRARVRQVRAPTYMQNSSLLHTCVHAAALGFYTGAQVAAYSLWHMAAWIWSAAQAFVGGDGPWVGVAMLGALWVLGLGLHV